MRTELALGLVSLATSLAAPACGGHSLDPDTLPPSIRPAYAVFAERCSKCHSLARPLDAPITAPGRWEPYVERMRRMPGSGINERDAARILQFLTYYTEESHAAREAQQ